MNRRKFIKTSLLSTLGTGLFTGVYSWQIEPFWLEFVNRNMRVANLPEKLIGKTVMQISDIHVSDFADLDYIIDSFLQAQKYDPDFVVYTGDYVSYRNKKQLSQLEKVLKYAVTGKVATFGILGNHDYGWFYQDEYLASQIVNLLKNVGVDVLINSQKEVEGLNFIGFDDYLGPNFDPSAVMNDYNITKANIVLCHNPDVCDLDVWNGYQGWILSGHTHGGQCKPPLFDPPVLPVENKRYTQGEFDLYDGRKLYINRALGFVKQVRFNVRPEITIFKLDKA
ncbi:metallophosphoesterase [Flammeovirga sp. EKP202]|uniref:metallophosphoesterase n=1 Tax=Flammeovirga sp. EKP202 TaxID=2770592 RepID=UPI00165EFF07|nr:metallophosphoesterase [Flammeovirga sp. EKP202]MBD0401363.1 metallophosphoesterase [Flammeovirga sp. EKP202]